MGREQAARVLDRYELAHAGEQRFESLSGGQQARFQILLLELSGATLLLLDEPTDNLDVQSAEALEEGLEAFEGTVLAVTHDRWFARGFDRFLVYGADGDGLRVRRAGLGRGPGAAGPLTPGCRRCQRAATVADRYPRTWTTSRRGVQGQLGGLAGPVLLVGHGDAVAGTVGADRRHQGVGAGDLLVVDLGDHVADLAAPRRRRSSRR